MLTFEKVLAIFDDYLQQDPLYEVVFTRPLAKIRVSDKIGV